MLDPRSGEVLALASNPTFNASPLANPATASATWQDLNADKSHPLLPRATQGLYVPGSIMKIVTEMAGLDSGAITPSTTFKQQPAAEQTVSEQTIKTHVGRILMKLHLPETDDMHRRVLAVLTFLDAR